MCSTQRERAGSKHSEISPQLEPATVQKTKSPTTASQDTIDIRYAIFSN